MNVGKVGRRGHFASVGPLGLLLLTPVLILLAVGRLLVLLVRVGFWLIWTTGLFVVDGVVWVVAHLSRREQSWRSSRRDEG